MLTHLFNAYQTHQQKFTGRRIWLACSGGRDSMVLAHAVYQLYLQRKLPFCPQLIHVNHGLQTANDDWARLVKKWATSLELPCYVVKANINATDSKNELSARTARYDAIMDLMNKDDVLILAHHANDQAETLLMRLFNGAGVAGLSAMKEWTSKTVTLSEFVDTPSIVNCTKTIYLWRPLLTVTREQITNHAQTYHLPYVDDPTNLDGDNIRSWLRRALLPSICNNYPKAIQSIIRSAELCADADSIINEIYQQDLTLCLNYELSQLPYDSVLDIEQVLSLSLARQRQLIHKWLQGNEPNSATKQRVDEILALVQRKDNDQQTQLDWQGENYQYSVRRYRHQLHRLRTDWLALMQSNQIWQTQPARKQQLIAQTLIKKNFLDINYRIRPLNKQDKFAFNEQQTPKSGKKLLQMLGVPSWERNSLKVVIIHHKKKEIPDIPATKKVLVIFSPRQVWMINSQG